jgi:hypothetical protein
MPKDPSTSGHTHTPDAPVRELEVAASCDRDGRYDEVVYCADCAEELSRVKKIVPSRGGHNFVQGKCTFCGLLKNPSQGLTYISNGDGTCYVDGLGICTDKDILIPSTSPLGDRVTSIGDEAFYNCTDLTSVIMGGEVQSIGYRAFFGCSGLKSISFSDTVSTIGKEAFCFCGGLTELTIPDTVDGEIVSALGPGCFRDCTELTTIILPDSLTTIESEAFAGCAKLRGLYIPQGVESIEENAFAGCVALEAICIPASVQRIAEGTFDDCARLLYINYDGIFERWAALYDDFITPFTAVICTNGTYYHGVKE